MSGEKRIKKGNALTAIVGVAVAVTIVSGKLFYLSFFKFDEYQKKVIDQLTTEIKVSADRGYIYDSGMNILASNYTVYDISISPSRINSLAESEKILEIWHSYYPSTGVTDVQDIIASFLSDTLDVDKEELKKKISKKRSLYATVKKGVETEEAEKIREFIDRFELDEQIFVNAASKRYYPYSSLASHTLGFTGSDNNGLYGLEYYYDDVLSGTDGKYIIARDAYGKEMPFDYESYVEAIDGNSIVTTIDMRVQSVLEKYLKEAYETHDSTNGVSGIVMNVNTGAILAMGTYPDYNLNDPFTLSDYYMGMLTASGLTEGSDEYSAKLSSLRAEMWRNKAVNTVYMPGSTFKVITVATTLEEKLARLGESFYCSGYHMVPGYGKPIKCHKTVGHGTLTLVGGLQQSCNPVMMTLAERMGQATFYQYFKSFGYLDKTGIDLSGEGKGVFYSPDAFSQVDLACASFGQNFGISMLQHIVGVSAAVNGGNLVVPHLLDKVLDTNGNVIKSYDTIVKRTVISAETSKNICDILGEATALEHSSRNAYVAGYRVGAKTGTTEKTDKRDENGDATLRIGSCVAFAPADDPQYIILIVNDEPRGVQWGSTNAAPYCGMVLEEILPMLGVEPEYTAEELETLTIKTGNYVGLTRERAEKLVGALGCDFEFVGSGDKVTAQSPAKDQTFTKGCGKVTLYLGTEKPKTEYTVPDVTGMNVAVANQILINAGFNVKVNGVKNFGLGSEVKVIAQNPSAGVKYAEGNVVIISSAYTDNGEE